MYFQIEEQKKRRKQIYDAILNEKSFEKSNLAYWGTGGLKGDSMLCFALLSQGDKYSDFVCDLFEEHKAELEGYNTFLPFMFINLILRYKDAIPKSVAKQMKDYIKNQADLSLADDWDFIGVNDNTPAMIAASLILSGEYFGKESWVACGKRRFEEFFEQLERRDFLCEFNSPTYTAITICAAASVAQFSNGCSALGLKIEEVLWKQLLKMTYLNVSNLAGPHSRAYLRDKLCMTYNARSALYMVLGDYLKVTPLNTVFENSLEIDEKERVFVQREAVWMASFEFHCPKKAVEELLNRSYPYRVSGKAEFSSSADMHLLEIIAGSSVCEPSLSRENLLRDDIKNAFKTDTCFEYPCGEVDIELYATPKFALGTCTKDWHNGVQTDCFDVKYTKNGGVAKRQEEIGTVFSNYEINSEFGEGDYGRKVAFQKDNCAMVLYSPTGYSKNVKNAHLSINFSNYKNLIKKVVCGKKTIYAKDLIKGEKITLDEKNIFAEAEGIYFHIMPLVNQKDALDASVKLAAKGDLMSIEIYNYCGEEKNFCEKEFRSLTNGFVFSAEEADKMSFEEFCSFYEKGNVFDKIICNTHTRYTFMREVKYTLGDLKLACCISPVSGGIKYIAK